MAFIHRVEPPAGPDLRSPVQRALDLVREQGLELVDLKFTDLPGTLQHLSVPAEELTEAAFAEGIGFDGSSIRGFQEIHESDMLLVPDPATAVVDPVCDVPTLSMFCNVRDPVSGESYSRDPRYVAQKAERYLVETGIADISHWGPELEFYVFDEVRYHTDEHSSMYFVDSEEGIWNSGRDGSRPNLGYRPRYKQGYFPAPPTDTLQGLRSRVVLALREAGIHVEAHHHEVGTAGQGEIDLRYTTLTNQGDQVQLYKYILRNQARSEGKTVTFMPKPLFNDNGSGMHVHQSLWRGGEPLFFDRDGYAQLSVLALHYLGGLLEHTPALLAFCAPTTNSYRRLVPGFEAPVNLVYSQRNRSACARIPMYSPNPKAKRLEYRPPDPSANIYLAFVAMLMAGLDGIERSTDPGEPLDVDLYELEPHELLTVQTTPGSLEEVLRALEEDHEFLLKGGVFTEDLIQTWISYKREHEIDPVRLRPHPYEFFLYYDV